MSVKTMLIHLYIHLKLSGGDADVMQPWQLVIAFTLQTIKVFFVCEDDLVKQNKYHSYLFETEIIFCIYPKSNRKLPLAFCLGNQGDVTIQVRTQKHRPLYVRGLYCKGEIESNRNRAQDTFSSTCLDKLMAGLLLVKLTNIHLSSITKELVRYKIPAEYSIASMPLI